MRTTLALNGGLFVFAGPHEVDVVLGRGNFGAIHPALGYGGDAHFTRDGVDVMPWSSL